MKPKTQTKILHAPQLRPGDIVALPPQYGVVAGVTTRNHVLTVHFSNGKDSLNISPRELLEVIRDVY